MSKQEAEAIRKMRTREAAIEEKTFAIWVFVRENRNKLDADRVCNRIKELLEFATQDVSQSAGVLIKENEKLKQKLREKTTELRKLKESVNWNHKQ